MNFKDYEKEEVKAQTSELAKQDEKQTGNRHVKKIYELILVDPIWDNWEHLGWVTDLKEAGAKLESYVIDKIQYALDNGAKIVYIGKGRKKVDKDEVDEVVYTKKGKKRGDPPIIDEVVVAPKKKKHEKFLTADEVEKVIKMPDDFIQEYTSTFCTCIDRPCITIEEMVDECLPNYELVGDEDGNAYEDYGEGTLCVRGFVHEWPVGAVARLMAWEDAIGVFEKFED